MWLIQNRRLWRGGRRFFRTYNFGVANVDRLLSELDRDKKFYKPFDLLNLIVNHVSG